MPDLVVGVDAGATTTRCLVVAADGTLVGSGTAPGANIRSSAGLPDEWFGRALAAALVNVRHTDVRAGVFGVAGAGSGRRRSSRRCLAIGRVDRCASGRHGSRGRVRGGNG